MKVLSFNVQNTKEVYTSTVGGPVRKTADGLAEGQVQPIWHHLSVSRVCTCITTKTASLAYGFFQTAQTI